jgi:phenylpyruvate tautomerase PptA (4-oxalocrotonate tautomerase family)
MRPRRRLTERRSLDNGKGAKEGTTMAQFKIYGERAHLSLMRDRLSATIHAVAIDVLGLPMEKRFHRFIGLQRDDFIHPEDRSRAYTIIEISLFEGRSGDVKRSLLKMLMQRITDEIGLSPADLEITLFETPRSHWAIRGELGDELKLTYDVER